MKHWWLNVVLYPNEPPRSQFQRFLLSVFCGQCVVCGRQVMAGLCGLSEMRHSQSSRINTLTRSHTGRGVQTSHTYTDMQTRTEAGRCSGVAGASIIAVRSDSHLNEITRGGRVSATPAAPLHTHPPSPQPCLRSQRQMEGSTSNRAR